MSDYNIEYLDKIRKAIYLEVEASVAEDIDCGFQWAIAKIKELEEMLSCELENATNKRIKELEAENKRLHEFAFKLYEYEYAGDEKYLKRDFAKALKELL